MILPSVLLIAASALCSVVLVFLGAGISGLGHGWSSGAAAAFISALTAPAGAVAWLARRTRTGPSLAGAVVLVNLLSDILVLGDTLGSETGKAQQVWSVMPSEVVLAGALCVAWQAIPVAALVAAGRSRGARLGSSGHTPGLSRRDGIT